MLVGVDLLISEKQHLPVQQRLPDRRDLTGLKRLAQINAADLCANGWRQRC